MELCPDAPGDNALRPGTWTRRHRSQIVSDRKLAKSNFKKDAGDDHAGPERRQVRLPNPKQFSGRWRIIEADEGRPRISIC